MSPIRAEIPLHDALSREFLENYRVLPVAVREGRVIVAAVGDPDPQVLDDIARLYEALPEVVVADEAELLEGIRVAADDATSMVELVQEDERFGAVDTDLLADARDLAAQPPVVRYVSLLIREAHEAGASDVHLEAGRRGMVVRLRVDGVLSEGTPPPKGLEGAVISRVKLLADLDIAERRVPQDGRIRMRLAEKELDLRVSTVPSLHGESVVLRLLDQGGRPATLDELGMAPEAFERFTALARRPHGVLLVTGPTGAGKTTTLHAALLLRDLAHEKVVAVEDPVEYQLTGVTQVPVNVRAGVTFAAVLRSALRHDPDVIMVGEMRDEETASIAVRAALTGHLVLSTLHTNDAFSAIPRLIDLGVEPYLVASTLDGVLAQRLVRRLCPACREAYRPDPQTIALLAGGPVGTPRLWRGVGCEACRHTGFRGRTGIFEMLVLDETMRDLIAREAPRQELRTGLAAGRDRSLREDGWIKVQAGLTTVEEVLRVTDA